MSWLRSLCPGWLPMQNPSPAKEVVQSRQSCHAVEQILRTMLGICCRCCIVHVSKLRCMHALCMQRSLRFTHACICQVLAVQWSRQIAENTSTKVGGVGAKDCRSILHESHQTGFLKMRSNRVCYKFLDSGGYLQSLV